MYSSRAKNLVFIKHVHSEDTVSSRRPERKASRDCQEGEAGARHRTGLEKPLQLRGYENLKHSVLYFNILILILNLFTHGLNFKLLQIFL